jgi:hypothetical protein
MLLGVVYTHILLQFNDTRLCELLVYIVFSLPGPKDLGVIIIALCLSYVRFLLGTSWSCGCRPLMDFLRPKNL